MKRLFPEVDEDTERAFARYHFEHPWIFKEFYSKTQELRSMGKKHYGAKAIMEAVRFAYDISHDDEFKINNNFTSLYARAAIMKDKTLDGFFELRPLTGLKKCA